MIIVEESFLFKNRKHSETTYCNFSYSWSYFRTIKSVYLNMFIFFMFILRHFCVIVVVMPFEYLVSVISGKGKVNCFVALLSPC